MSKTPTHTPAKKPFAMPSAALAEAVETEWLAHPKFIVANMPLTALAYTAIDRIAPQKEAIVEALLVYLDTDTLCYRESENARLKERQVQDWDPVLTWAAKQYGVILHTAGGVMPIEQSPALHEAVRAALMAESEFRLAALSVMASIYSSLLLALAVLAGQYSAQAAFALSRLEEEVQAEQWGRDSQATERKQKLQEEIIACERFLRLLEAA